MRFECFAIYVNRTSPDERSDTAPLILDPGSPMLGRAGGYR
jgi:hypothetical protein